MMKPTEFLLVASASLLATIATGVASAQSRAGGTATLEEIVVTAEKREESIQDVPVSITAISGAALERLAVRSFDDVLELIPGLSSDSPIGQGVGNRTFGIRGVQSQSLAWLVSENTVGFYIDNTPIPLQDPRLVDLERVEVLRGPQGTLYGSSTLAGLMKLVTKKPSFDKFEGHVSLEYNEVDNGDNGSDIQAAANIPLSDNFAVRLTGYVEDTPAYIDWRPVDLFATPTGAPDNEDYNPTDNVGGRIAALWQATERFSINFSYMFNDIDAATVGFNDGFSPSLGSSPKVLGRELGPQLTEMTLITGELEYDFGPVLLQMTNSEFDNESRTANADATEAFGFVSTPIQTTFGDYNHFRDEFVHETRLLSTWDRKWNFIAGAFYNKRKQFYRTRFPQEPGTVVDLSIFLGFPPGTLVFPNPPSNFIFASTSTRLIEETAVFGQLSYDFNDQWTASVGLRAFEFETELFDNFLGNPILVAGGDIVLNGASEADDVVGRLNLEYRPNDDTMFFATFAEGFRAGASNFPLAENVPSCAADIADKLGPAGAQPDYESDTVWNYELGVKRSWADGRVTTNATLFGMDWEDVQILIAPVCGLNGYVDNIGDAKTVGIEFDMDAAVTDNLYVGVGFSYTKAEWDGPAQPEGGSFVYAADGDQIPDVPEVTGNLRVQYEFPIRGNMNGFIRGTYSYRDERFTLATATIPSATKDAYSLLNIRAGVRINDMWTVTIFGENLTDEQPTFRGEPYIPNGLEIGGVPIDQSLRPRTIGLGLRADF